MDDRDDCQQNFEPGTAAGRPIAAEGLTPANVLRQKPLRIVSDDPGPEVDPWEENIRLREALVNRAVIEQAKGVLMDRNAVDAETAFTILQGWSQLSNIKLRHIAETMMQLIGPDQLNDGADRQLARWLQEQLQHGGFGRLSSADAATTEHCRTDPEVIASGPTEFHVVVHGPGDWQVSRNGVRVGVYRSQTVAIRAAFDHARQEQSAEVVVHDDHGHVRHRGSRDGITTLDQNASGVGGGNGEPPAPTPRLSPG